ncbi:unnamed protein product, partial [Iphiclides podalirius]
MKATSGLLVLIDRLGKVFAPVKHDMQGNIDKIKKHYRCEEDACLLQLMLEEVQKGKPIAAEGVLWLNRALLFFELTFQEMLLCLKAKQYDVNMKNIFTAAYKGSVKQYHNWITQQLFHGFKASEAAGEKLVEYIKCVQDTLNYYIFWINHGPFSVM